MTKSHAPRTPPSTDAAPAAAAAPAPGTWARTLDDLEVADALLTTLQHRWDAAGEEWGAECTTMDFALTHLHRAMNLVQQLRDAATAAPSAPRE